MSGFTKRTIDKYIRERIKYWIFDLGRNAPKYLKEDLGFSGEDELTDEDKLKAKKFQHDITKSVIVTGGCFTSMLLGEEPNDLDVYFTDREVAKLVSTFYLNRMLEKGELVKTDYVHKIEIGDTDDGIHIMVRSQGVSGDGIDTRKYRYFEAYPDAATDDFFKQYRKKVKDKHLDPKAYGNAYQVSFLSSNAITLNNGIQLIVRFVGDVDFIHSKFDFIHATNHWTWDEGVVYKEAALSATLEKRLYYFGSHFPVASIFRMRKFIERGWRISAGEMLKIAFDVSKLNLEDVNVLRDQSIGMDSAYFNQVIHLLRERDTEVSQAVDRTYLFHIIDEVFQMHDKQDKWLNDAADAVQGTQTDPFPEPKEPVALADIDNEPQEDDEE